MEKGKEETNSEERNVEINKSKNEEEGKLRDG